MMPSRSIIMLSSIVALMSTNDASAFTSQGRPALINLALQASQFRQDELPWFELPAPRKPKSSFTESLPSVETVVGRVAMIGALGFIFGELTTGESVSEQIACAITRL